MCWNMHGPTTRSRCQRKQQANVRGLTAIELMVVLCVLVVLLVIAWPQLRTWRGAMLGEKLVEALESHDRAATLKLLKKGATPDAWSGASPHYCLRCQIVWRNDVEMACLVFPKADPGASNVPKHNPPLLSIAVTAGTRERLTLLREAMVHVKMKANEAQQRSPVSGQSTATDTLEMVTILLDAGARVHELAMRPASPPNKTVLYRAVNDENAAMVARLLEYAAKDDSAVQSLAASLRFAIRINNEGSSP